MREIWPFRNLETGLPYADDVFETDRIVDGLHLELASDAKRDRKVHEK